MKKVLIVIGCILLAGGLLGLDYWQQYTHGQVSEQLQQDNEEIQQLIQERNSLEKQSEEPAQTDETQEHTEGPKAVLCFNSLNQTFYTEIYPAVKKTVDAGIVVLEKGKLPGDRDYISAEALSELMGNGWVCAVSVDRNANLTQWKADVTAYLEQLGGRSSVKPTAYYLSSGSVSAQEAEMLTSLGFDTVLCHEEPAENTVGDLHIIQLMGYNDPETLNKIAASEAYCGMEIWASWNTSVLARVRYTAEALERILHNDTVSLVSVSELMEETAEEDASLTPEEQIAEINQRIAELYH